MSCVKVVLLVSLLLVSVAFGQSCNINNSQKIDCGYSGITEQQCNSKGCCWVPAGQGSSTPWCFYGSNYTTNVPLPPPPPAGAPFSNDELNTMFGFYRLNLDIQGMGGVVASPDTSTPGGSYYYHWERDGALSMGALQLITDYSYYNPLMQTYVQWVLNVQNEPDPNGIDVRTEPKYNLPYGDVYSGSWCRPQTDGPGLRAMALIKYANTLISQGQKSYVTQYLWTGNPNVHNGGAIKFDLDWVVSGWPSNGCDLWEEVQSTDFFWNRMTMKAALFEGSTFAQSMGDSSSASTYQSTAQSINQTLAAHWNGEFVFESTNREEDSAVIMAFNEGYSNDGYFAPTDPEVTATINTFNTYFYFAYDINLNDSSAGVPGILYGRYQGDTYAGGNPWILTSASLAELFYRGATYTINENEVPHKDTWADWQQIFSRLNHKHHDIRKLSLMTPLEWARMIATTGDGVLDRIRYHVESYGFHLSEQLDKNTGVEVSATDLTWSYANVLKAMYYRNEMSQTVLARYPHLAKNKFISIAKWM